MIPDSPCFQFLLGTHPDDRTINSQIPGKLIIVQLILADDQYIIVFLQVDKFHFFFLPLVRIQLFQIQAKICSKICCPVCQQVQIPLSGVCIVLYVDSSQIRLRIADQSLT